MQRKQRTIRTSQSCQGVGLHTGVKTTITFHPAPENFGIRFIRSDIPGCIEIKADIVIKALGFDPENLPKLFDDPNLTVSNWGTIKINMKSMETSIPGVFAAGDIVRGASLVVWAIRDGRDAALSIQKFLEDKKLKITKAA